MAYYGGFSEDLNDLTLNDFDEFSETSRNNLVDNNRGFSAQSKSNFDKKSINNKPTYIYDHNDKRVEYKPGLIEKNDLKEIQVHDPITNKTLEHLPITVKIPTISGDEYDLANKKLLTDKQKFLGIGQEILWALIGILVFILLCAIAGLVISAYYFATDASASYEWKIFGIIVCGCAIIIIIAILVFIFIYANIRYKKYKKALYEELKDTDQYGNPIKTANLDKMYKHSKAIKQPVIPEPPKKAVTPLPTVPLTVFKRQAVIAPIPVASAPPPVSVVKIQQPQIVTQPITKIQQPQVVAINTQQIAQPIPIRQTFSTQQRTPILANLVNRLVRKPQVVQNTGIAPLVLPGNTPFQQQGVQFVKSPVTPSLIQIKTP